MVKVFQPGDIQSYRCLQLITDLTAIPIKNKLNHQLSPEVILQTQCSVGHIYQIYTRDEFIIKTSPSHAFTE